MSGTGIKEGARRAASSLRESHSSGVQSAPERFARRALRVRRQSRRPLYVLAVLAAVAVVVAWVVLFSPLCRVTGATYSGIDDPALTRTVSAAAKIPEGEPLVKVDTSAIRDRISALGIVARVDVAKVFPNRLAIDVSLRKPVIAAAGADGKLAVVDRDGVAYATVDKAPQGVPTVATQTAGDKGQLRAAATAIAALSADQVASARDIAVSSAGEVSFKLGNIAVTWGDGSDSSVKAAVLGVLMTKSGVHAVNLSEPSSPVVS